MCRITAIFDPRKHRTNPLEKMRDSLAHGGPDSSDAYFDPKNGVGLGHRRLSIIDLSDAGKQPMRWKNWVMVFNGEIYNYQEIRAQLNDFQFTTDTDGEVILKSFEKWGLECLPKFRGMFSIFLWDEAKESLTLIRDRMGVKPVYYYFNDGLFMAASELKAFHEHPDFDKTIDHRAVSLFLQQGYIESPHSIFQHVKKLPSGHFLEVDKTGISHIKSYWDAEKIYKNSTLDTRPEAAILEELEPILTESFKLRMVADVPVGMFLSGGIDSSLVTSIIQHHTNQQVKTFTIGFENPAFNEAPHAKSVAQHIGTDHHEIICTEDEFKKVMPKMPFLYDEPFGAGSSIPTFLVSQLAKKTVKVSLSADGGDEIFGGYTKYQMTKNLFPKVQNIPAGLRRGMLGLTQIVDPSTLEKYGSGLPFFNKFTNLETKFFKLRNALGANNLVDFFNRSSSYISKENLQKLHPHFQERFVPEALPHPDRMLGFLGMIDMKTYLEGEVMTKVDRATMHNALEGREPFLDQNIIEFAMRLPDDLKMKNGVAKYPLRQILYKYVPKNIVDRPKQGFDIPKQQWLSGFLKPELEEMAADQRFSETFLFDPIILKGIVDDFFSQKKYVNVHFVWFLFILHQWYKTWL